MADTRLRRLERLAATGDHEAQAALLVERMRTGDLTREMLELVAYCGDPTARGALGGVWASFPGTPCDGLPDQHPDAATLSNWLTGLTRWGKVVMIRASIAAARVAFANWSRKQECDGTGRDPILNHYDNTPTGRYWEYECYCCRAPRRAIEAAEIYRDCPCEDHGDAWERISVAFPWMLERDDSIEAMAIRIKRCARLAGEAAVRAAICADLIPWALR